MPRLHQRRTLLHVKQYYDSILVANGLFGVISASILALNATYSYIRCMEIAQTQLISVLSQFNPWWRGEMIRGMPSFKRAAFTELLAWARNPPAPRAVLLSGARQVGKTTLLQQTIQELLNQGIPAGNILYATFDHPILKLAGIDAVIQAWNERILQATGPQFLFLDEVQFIRDWATWLKLQVDFEKQRRIFLTGSATPLLTDSPESGVGRWYTIRLTTLSFYEYIKIKNLPESGVPPLSSLADLYNVPQRELFQIRDAFQPVIVQFHEYLIRGGFPQTALVEDIFQAQKLLREDIIDKVLKRDMTALFGVRLILELENTFVYLCLHNGGILDMKALCNALEVKRPTAQNYLDLLEAAHLIYRLPPMGYGKSVLRGRFKIYLADPSLAPAILLQGMQLLENPEELGAATEAAVFKHLYSRYYTQSIKFSYWKGKGDVEVDLVAEFASEVVPFEIKYRNQQTEPRMLKGLIQLMKENNISRGYVVTKSLDDFGLLETSRIANTTIMRIPASLLCYWMGQSEPRIS